MKNLLHNKKVINGWYIGLFVISLLVMWKNMIVELSGVFF